MDKQELKLRESQNQEKENDARILRSIYDKVAQTPFWAKAVILLLLLNLCVVSANLYAKHENTSFGKAKRSFWKAAALESVGNTRGMNLSLNELAAASVFKNRQVWRDNHANIAETQFSSEFYDAYMTRVLLVETPGGEDILNRALKASSDDPVAWQHFLNSQKKETAVKADIETTIH